MKEFKSRIKIEAIQFDPKNPIEVNGVKISKGWTPSGNFHDRFNEEPEKPTYYVIDKDGDKTFINTKSIIVKYTLPNMNVFEDTETWYEVWNIDKFNALHEII